MMNLQKSAKKPNCKDLEINQLRNPTSPNCAT